MEEITIEQLKKYASKVEGATTRVYDWPEVLEQILALNKPVTAGQVAKMAGTKQPMQARQWLKRQCVDFTEDEAQLKTYAATNKFFRYPPIERDPSGKAQRPTQRVVYVPVSTFLNHLNSKPKSKK